LFSLLLFALSTLAPSIPGTVEFSQSLVCQRDLVVDADITSTGHLV